MTRRVRPIAIAGAALAVAGYLAYAALGDGLEAYTSVENVGLAALMVGLGLLVLAAAVRLWRSTRPAVHFAAIAPGLLAAIFFLAGLGSLINLSDPRTGSAGPSASPPATASPRTTLGATPPATSSPTPSAATAAPSPSATSTLVAGTSALEDPVGDLLDENGTPASGPAHVDIELVTVSATSGDLTMSIAAASAPPSVDPVAQEIAYGWWIDISGDDTPEWQVLIQNSMGADANISGWIAGLLDVPGGQWREGRGIFPGTLEVDTNRVSVTLALSEIGNPSVVRAAAFTQDTAWSDPLTNVVRQDLAPDRQWPDGTEWITVLAE